MHYIDGKAVSDSEWFRELDKMAREDECGGDHVGRVQVSRYVGRDWAQGSSDHRVGEVGRVFAFDRG